MAERTTRIQRALSRRSFLKSAPVIASVALGVSSGLISESADAQVKLSHQLAMYQDTPKNGQQCSTCVQFQPPASCKLVQDPIIPKGWCLFYAKKN